MSLYSQFKTDEKLEKEGILLEFGLTDNGKPIHIRIARAGGANKMYERLLEAEVKPYRRMIQNESIDNSIVQGILRRVYSKAVIIDWENVQDAEGKDIPFSVENCHKLLQDLPDLFLNIQDASQRAALFRVDTREADGKN